MIHLAVDKYGFPLAINVSPANRHDSKGIVPVLHQLAGRGFKGTVLGDLSYRGERLSKAGEALGITIQPSAGGHGGTFIPDGTPRLASTNKLLTRILNRPVIRVSVLRKPGGCRHAACVLP